MTPLIFENLGMPYGYVLYRTSSIGDISKAGGADLILDIGKFGDRANVFVDKVAIIFFYIYISSIYCSSVSCKKFRVVFNFKRS